MARDYSRQMTHKKKMKERFAHAWYMYGGYGSYESLERSFNDSGRRCEYWKTYSLTKQRCNAKRRTNKIIRSKYKNTKQQTYIENCFLPSYGGSYRKFYDYAYEIW